MYGKNNNKLVTFVCEADGCTNEKTIYKSVYRNYKSHACCKECAAKIKKKDGKSMRKPIVEKISTAQKIDEYFRNYPTQK